MSFRQEFERIVQELEAHPEVEVIGHELAPPAEEADVIAAIAGVGLKPTEGMVGFYTQHNGCYLEWGLAGEDYEATVGGLGGFPDYGTPPGVINILPVGEAFSASWQDDFIINQEIGDEPFQLAYGMGAPETRPTAVVIDLFSNYHHSDMLIGPEPLIVVASDHGADLSCSDFLTFEQYLELVIARYGTNPQHAVGIGWSRKARRVETIERPTLDALIAKAQDDGG